MNRDVWPRFNQSHDTYEWDVTVSLEERKTQFHVLTKNYHLFYNFI